MEETAPRPIFGFVHQTPPDRVAVDVAQLFDSLLVGPDVEVVIARGPERRATPIAKFSRDDLLQHLEGGCKPPAFGLTHQQVDMFGHDHVPADEESIPLAHPLQCTLKGMSSLRLRQQRFPLITTEGDEMQVAVFLISREPTRHADRILDEKDGGQ